MTDVLEVRNLKTHFFTDEGVVKAVDDVSFSVARGKTLGLVGESGCGKSVTAMSITRLISPPGRVVGGEVLLNGRNLAALSDREMRQVRGAQVSMIFQEPMTALNPVLQVGFQIAESVLAHEKVSKREAWSRAVEMMKAVSIPDPEKRAEDYPHQLSGGMRQRVMIAMALVCNPALVIADEPTTALDVTIQAQILELLDSLREKYHLSLILISHDLGVIAEVAETVAVMYAGKIVEMGPAMDVFHNPKHPYTQGLLRSVPRLGDAVSRKTASGVFTPSMAWFRTFSTCRRAVRLPRVAISEPSNAPFPRFRWSALPATARSHRVRFAAFMPEATQPLLSVQHLKKYFPIHKGIFSKVAAYVKAVDDISFDINRGETFGLVGESGCGKTTAGRAILRLLEPDAGSIQFDGIDLMALGKQDLRRKRRDMQIIFQDPFASLNPRMTIRSIVGEPFAIHRIASGSERRGSGGGSAQDGRPRFIGHESISARVQRWPEAADRHRPGSRTTAEVDCRRRTGIRARRIDSGADHQFAG